MPQTGCPNIRIGLGFIVLIKYSCLKQTAQIYKLVWALLFSYYIHASNRLPKYTNWSGLYCSHTIFMPQTGCPNIRTGLGFTVFILYSCLKQAAQIYKLVWALLFSYNIHASNRLPKFHYENTPIQIYRKFHLQKLKIFR